MTNEHPNVSLVRRFGEVLSGDVSAGAADVLPDEFVLHYINPRLPDVQGDYVGLAGVQSFLDRLRALSGGTFAVEPIAMATFGDELVVAHAKPNLTYAGMAIEMDGGGHLARARWPDRRSVGYPDRRLGTPPTVVTCLRAATRRGGPRGR